MKKEYKFLLAVLFLFLAGLIYWHYISDFYFSKTETIISIFFLVLVIIASLLLGSLNKGKALSLNLLNKGEKIRILANCHPANFKLGDKRNVSYYMIKRGCDDGIYLFKGQENYQHLPYQNFDFVWNGQKLVPQKTKRD